MEETVLEIKDIQGHILPEYNKDYQTFLFFEIVEVALAKDWLSKIQSSIVTLEEVLTCNRLGRATGNHRQNDADASVGTIWVNIAFSYRGLRKLTSDADLFTDSAFKEGLHNRSELLGDPFDKDGEGNCNNWVIGGPKCLPDIMLIVGGDDQNRLADEVTQMESNSNSGLRLIFKQTGAVLPPPLKGHEHFGFRDCISQPCLRGRVSDAPDDFLTLRQNSPNPHQGKPGYDLIWPGEFIFGYPRQSPVDKLQPGAVAEAEPAWIKNGSFLVFRRLCQDVKAFHSFIESVATDLAKKSSVLAGITPEKLKTKLMGRWPSGTPILLAPDTDNPDIGQDSWVKNDFLYENSSRTMSSQNPRQGNENEFSQLSGDVLGVICPHSAHIRKAFPRDTQTIGSSEVENLTHRLLRRGIPFGEPFPAPGERGLLFLAYQTSIERQFEFITTNWINNPNFPESLDGHDPIIGQNNNLGENRVRTWTFPVRGSDGNVIKVSINLPTDWVIPTGGGYFFVPSISALEHLADG